MARSRLPTRLVKSWKIASKEKVVLKNLKRKRKEKKENRNTRVWVEAKESASSCERKRRANSSVRPMSGVIHANARAHPSGFVRSVSTSAACVARSSRGKRRWSRLGNVWLSISGNDNGPLTLLHVHGSRKGSEGGAGRVRIRRLIWRGSVSGLSNSPFVRGAQRSWRDGRFADRRW